jgi:hypothetical protein
MATRERTGGRRIWTVVTFNDAGHLGAAAPAESPRDAVPTHGTDA